MQVDYNFYKDITLIPIQDVADLLGLKPETNGQYKCPCHNDTHPSMTIDKTGKYNNKFKCFACGETGNPLLLTLAVNHNITPSEYFKNPKEYNTQIIDCITFLDKYFPGAIIKENPINTNNKKTFPQIPIKIKQEIGLETRFGEDVKIRPYNKKIMDSETYETIKNKNDLVNFPIFNEQEKIELLMNKMEDYFDKLLLKRKNIYKDFPEMPIEGRKYIDEMIDKKYNEVLYWYQELDQYKEIYYPEKTLTEEIEEFEL